MIATTPFSIAIPQDPIDDLHRRLRLTRWPDAIEGADWADGADLAFLRRLADHWEKRFDWRAQESALNALPQFTAEVGGLRIHFLYKRGTGPSPMPLLLGHGWPGTGFDLRRLLPLLDSFDVVVPSLPGYGFSERPTRPGFGPERVAEMWQELMTGLGYERFGLHAGDWGAAVSIWMASRFPDRVIGTHLNFIPGLYRPSVGEGAPPLSASEKAFIERLTAWFDAEGGYHRLQSTKPQTPAFGLTDSPIGLAAWIVEKMRGWSDCDGDVERVFTLDDILTNVSLFWFTGTIGSSMRFYRENRLRPNHFGPGERVRPPLGVAAYEHDVPPPREWVERVFDVRRWTSMPSGGHFGAFETPESLAHEIREFFRPLA